MFSTHQKLLIKTALKKLDTVAEAARIKLDYQFSSAGGELLSVAHLGVTKLVENHREIYQFTLEDEIDSNDGNDIRDIAMEFVKDLDKLQAEWVSITATRDANTSFEKSALLHEIIPAKLSAAPTRVDPQAEN